MTESKELKSTHYFYVLPCTEQQMFKIGITVKFINEFDEIGYERCTAYDYMVHNPDFSKSYLIEGEESKIRYLETNFKHFFKPYLFTNWSSIGVPLENEEQPEGYTETFQIDCYNEAWDWIHSQIKKLELKLNPVSIKHLMSDKWLVKKYQGPIRYRHQLPEFASMQGYSENQVQLIELLTWAFDNYDYATDCKEYHCIGFDTQVNRIRELYLTLSKGPFFSHDKRVLYPCLRVLHRGNGYELRVYKRQLEIALHSSTAEIDMRAGINSFLDAFPYRIEVARRGVFLQ